MDHVNEQAPRLTPEEAEARAAALIAQYRNQAKGEASSARSSALPPGFAWAVVYLVGVFGGTVFHAKPMLAVVLGLPTLLIAKALMTKRRSDSTSVPK